VQKRPPKSGLRFSNSQAIHSENARTVLLAVVRHTHEANYKETSLQKLIYEQDLQLRQKLQIWLLLKNSQPPDGPLLTESGKHSHAADALRKSRKYAEIIAYPGDFALEKQTLRAIGFNSRFV
jgi:hypothetical protein